MGLTDFSGYRGNTVLHFNWEFVTIDGVFGVQVEASIPTSVDIDYKYGLSRQGVTQIYIKTWNCPSEYFFDLEADLCSLCLVENCQLCENSTFCFRCNETFNFFLNLQQEGVIIVCWKTVLIVRLYMNADNVKKMNNFSLIKLIFKFFTELSPLFVFG